MAEVTNKFQLSLDELFNQGVRQGRARILSRMIQRKFGAEAAARLTDHVDELSSHHHVDRFTDALTECSTGEEFIDRVDGWSECSHYTYRITWSGEDDEHVGRCAEFPSLTWMAPSPGQALAGIRRLVMDTVEEMRANGEPVPDPMAEAGG